MTSLESCINTQHQNMAEVVQDTSEKHSPLEPSVTPCLKIENEESKEASPELAVAENSVKKVDFDAVSLDDSDSDDDEDGDDEDDDERNENKPKKKRLKKKKPKHILIEDDSSSDDDANVTDPMEINPSDLTWLLWMWYYITAVSGGALKAAEFLGEKLAAFFGITTPKYQYVIDEYYKLKELEKEEEEKEQKEKELIAQRKIDDLARLEGGGQSFVLNEQ